MSAAKTQRSQPDLTALHDAWADDGEAAVSIAMSTLEARLLARAIHEGEQQAAERLLRSLVRDVFGSRAMLTLGHDPHPSPNLIELARLLARAIEAGDGEAAADHAHRLCMDLAGVPVLRGITIGPAPWSGEEREP